MNKLNHNKYNIEILPHFKCNYNCEYCLNLEHKNNIASMSTRDIDKIFEYFNYITEPFTLIISGGEPLIYENIIYLTQKAINQNNISRIEFLTNFNNSELLVENNNIFFNEKIIHFFSFHTKEIVKNTGIETYYKNIERLKKHTNNFEILFLITNIEEYTKENIKYLNLLKNNIKDIESNIKVKPVNDLRLEYILKYNKLLKQYDDDRKTNHIICNFKNIYLNCFCYINRFISITPDGNILNCIGKIDNINLLNTNSYNNFIQILNQYTQCPYKKCWCPDRIHIEKRCINK